MYVGIWDMEPRSCKIPLWTCKGPKKGHVANLLIPKCRVVDRWVTGFTLTSLT